MEKEYTYINPYQKDIVENNGIEAEYKIKFSKDIEVDTIYLHNTQFEVESHKKRPLVRVRIEQSKFFSIRKIGGKNTLKKEEVTFDTLTLKELNNGLTLAKESVIKIKVEEASFWDKYYRYFKSHPKDDIRLAYNMFLLGLLVGGLSILLGVWGVVLGLR